MRERAREPGLQEIAGFEIVEAPFTGDDRERRRWYADGGTACLVLTESGELLEPFPTFGPLAYRRLAREVSLREANTYATAHGYVHLRHVTRLAGRRATRRPSPDA